LGEWGIKAARICIDRFTSSPAVAIAESWGSNFAPSTRALACATRFRMSTTLAGPLAAQPRRPDGTKLGTAFRSRPNSADPNAYRERQVWRDNPSSRVTERSACYVLESWRASCASSQRAFAPEFRKSRAHFRGGPQFSHTLHLVPIFPKRGYASRAACSSNPLTSSSSTRSRSRSRAPSRPSLPSSAAFRQMATTRYLHPH